MSKCFVDGCEKETYRKGERKCSAIELTSKYCRMHYTWISKRGSLEPTTYSQGTLKERLERRLRKIKKTDEECWFWAFGKSKNGYGVISDDNGKMLGAHRASYQYHYGDLENKDYVLHSCDNPSCINPKHLRKGTCSENIKEAFDKGRKKQPILFGENNPKSKLTLENVRFIRNNPQLGHKEIADMFGLSPNCIRGVRIGRTWKGIE